MVEIGSYDWYVKTVDLIRHRFFTLKDFSNQGRAYFSEDFDFGPVAVEKNLRKFPNFAHGSRNSRSRFENLEEATEPTIESIVKAFAEAKGTKLGLIMNGAPTLLTGVAVGPSMLAVFEVIGRERSILRLRSGIAWN